jgi:hypothetical protein
VTTVSYICIYVVCFLFSSTNKRLVSWSEMKRKVKFTDSAYSYLHVISQCDAKSRKQLLVKSADSVIPGLCELLFNIQNGNLGKKPQSSDLKLITAILGSEKKKRMTIVNKALVSGQLVRLLRVYLNRYDNRRKNTDRETSDGKNAASDD